MTSSEVTTNDVTQEYYDIKIRLETKKEALKNYYKLLKEAKTIQESLEVQRYITDLTAEIESMEGMLKYYDSKVDLSSIHLSIRQHIVSSTCRYPLRRSICQDCSIWDHHVLSGLKA